MVNHHHISRYFAAQGEVIDCAFSKGTSRAGMLEYGLVASIIRSTEYN